MSRILKLPRIGMNIDEGTIVEWHVKPGDEFKSGDVLYSIETDKTTAEVEAPCDGIIEIIHAKVGDDVSVGDNICEITDK